MHDGAAVAGHAHYHNYVLRFVILNIYCSFYGNTVSTAASQWTEVKKGYERQNGRAFQPASYICYQM